MTPQHILIAFIVAVANILLSLPVYAETAYERVIRTGEIKCGYTPYTTWLSKDVNTGEIKGFYKDIFDEIGKRLDLKIVWAEEVGWGQQIEGLNTNRYDLICSPVSVTPSRTKAVDYLRHLFYVPVHIWIKQEDTRFDHKTNADLNDPQFTISTLDGEQTSSMAKSYFPKAKTFSLPQTSNFSDLMLNVVTGKADFTFSEPTAVYQFMENNPNSLKLSDSLKPVTIVPTTGLIHPRERRLKIMLDNMLDELHIDGFVEDIITKYEPYPGAFYRIQKPYEVTQ